MVKLRQQPGAFGKGSPLKSATSDLRCERCFSTCTECLRPYSAFGCTACSGDSYLSPFLSPPPDVAEALLVAPAQPEVTRLLTAGSTRDRILVGSCVARCPTGYFANETSRICEQYVALINTPSPSEHPCAYLLS